jgi:truncated hemoglobin YjbI
MLARLQREAKTKKKPKKRRVAAVDADFESLTVSELRRFLKKRGASFAGCIERQDLIERCQEVATVAHAEEAAGACAAVPDAVAPGDASGNVAGAGAEAAKAPLLPLNKLLTVLGEGGVTSLVDSFYTRVYDDKECPWFAQAFSALAPKYHAVATQAAYWISEFGGNREWRIYPGGDRRVHFHHSRAPHVMTERGAVRWLVHMRATLDETLPKISKDPSVRATLDKWLMERMCEYGRQFGFDGEQAWNIEDPGAFEAAFDCPPAQPYYYG